MNDAQAVVESFEGHFGEVALSDHQRSYLAALITAALNAREREVWEKAATEVMRYHNAFLHDGFRGELKRLAEWCRRQGGRDDVDNK